MKNLFLSLSFFIICFAANSQDYIQTAMQSGTWISSDKITDTTVFAMDEIIFYKISQPVDSLDSNVSLWTFNDSLSLSFFDVETKTISHVQTYSYSYFQHQFFLKDVDKLTYSYDVGITSSGSFLMFVRKE